MTVTAKKLPPGATIGILGGGQLGRMSALAASRLGYRCHIYAPEDDGPGMQVAAAHTVAGYEDADALARFAAAVDVVTFEFENVPARTLSALAAHRPVSPSADAVQVCQHRALEKAHFAHSGVPCVPFLVVDCDADLVDVEPALFPGILKTSTLGYDGKGQAPVDSKESLAAAWRAMGSVPCLLERQVNLRLEFSVIVARDGRGDCVHLPVQHNLHRGGILAVTQVPAPGVPAAVASRAVTHARTIAESLSYVGVLCVEFFLLADGSVLANEMAPRPHNSGHYSLDACDVSQFELQVRALAGLPLVAPRLHSPAVMLNLLGDLWFSPGSTEPVTPPWDAVLALPGAHLHLYGKPDARRGRKMGHLTITAGDAATARAQALKAAAMLGLPPF